MELQDFMELGLCPQHVFGSWLHIEDGIIWYWIQQRWVRTSNNVLPKGNYDSKSSYKTWACFNHLAFPIGVGWLTNKILYEHIFEAWLCSTNNKPTIFA